MRTQAGPSGAVIDNAGREAGAKASTERFVAACEELVFLTEVYGLDVKDAERELGRSEEACRRYWKYLGENPEVRLRVLAVYNGDDEELT